MKKLIRPKEGRILFGVCAGIGNYFDIDPVIVRIVFIVLTIWGGAGIILYIIGIFLIPDEKNTKNEKLEKQVKSAAEEIKQTAKDKTNINQGTMIFGLIVLSLGIIFLFSNFFPWFGWGKLWPLILVAFGLLILAGTSKKGGK